MMHDERSSVLPARPVARTRAKATAHPISQTWLDGLAVLLGLALAISAYLGWMSVSRAQDSNCDASIQLLD